MEVRLKAKEILFLLIGLTAKSIFATPWGVNFFGGINIPQIHQQQHVAINNEITNQYITQSASTAGLWGIGINYSLPFTFHTPLVIHIATNYYYFSPSQTQGIDQPFINAGQFDTLTFHYKTISSVFLAEPKLIYTKYSWQPVLFFGIGVAYNQFAHFGEVPTNLNSAAAAPLINFGNHHQSSLAGEVGIGVQKQIFIQGKIQVWASLDYRYLHLGQGNFTSIPLQTGGQGFVVNNMNSQVLNFGLRLQG